MTVSWKIGFSRAVWWKRILRWILKMSFFSLLVPKKLTNRRKNKWHYRKAEKGKKIYTYICLKVECYQLKRKTRYQSRVPSQYIWGYWASQEPWSNHNLWYENVYRDHTNKDFTLTVKAVTVIGYLCFQSIVNGKS